MKVYVNYTFFAGMAHVAHPVEWGWKVGEDIMWAADYKVVFMHFPKIFDSKCFQIKLGGGKHNKCTWVELVDLPTDLKFSSRSPKEFEGRGVLSIEEGDKGEKVRNWYKGGGGVFLDEVKGG